MTVCADQSLIDACSFLVKRIVMPQCMLDETLDVHVLSLNDACFLNGAEYEVHIWSPP